MSSLIREAVTMYQELDAGRKGPDEQKPWKGRKRGGDEMQARKEEGKEGGEAGEREQNRVE